MEFRTAPVATRKWPNSLRVTAWHSTSVFSLRHLMIPKLCEARFPEAKQKVGEKLRGAFDNFTTLEVQKLKFKTVQ